MVQVSYHAKTEAELEKQWVGIWSRAIHKKEKMLKYSWFHLDNMNESTNYKKTLNQDKARLLSPDPTVPFLMRIPRYR